jgi:serine/threonine-protein kinase
VTIDERLGRDSILALDDWADVKLQEPFGMGGMGVVHKGWLTYRGSGRLAGTPAHPVAVKVLRVELRGSERARRMFEREAMALARLDHPNVVRFIALAEQAGQLAIVMELVHGRALSRVIGEARSAQERRALCLPLAEAFRYFSELLGGLAAVHALGILHRDVKSPNVLVRSDGAVKLSDFGIARLPESSAKITGGLIPGTGAYMSPEQVRGDELDFRSDLYSAAIVLYEMLSGVTPFDLPERDEMALRTAQLEEAPLALSQRVAPLPTEVDRVLARALAKDRNHRYSSALELGDAVRAALGFEAGPAWAAQHEFAGIAKTISEPVPSVDPELLLRAEVLRTAMMTRQ